MSKRRNRPGIPQRSVSADPPRPGGGFTISLASLPPPPSAGFVDACHVVDRGLYLEFTFTQVIGDSPEVCARTNVFIEDVIRRLWKPSQTFYNDVGSQLQAAGLKPSEIDDKPLEGDRSVIAHAATLLHIARTGLFAELGFYCLSPRSFILAKKGGKGPEVVPLFSVQMPLPLAIGILARLEALAPTITQRLPTALTGSVE